MAQLNSKGKMAEQLSPESFGTIFDNFLPENEASFCESAKQLLKLFAEVRPTDIAFLKPEDLVDLKSSGFAGIPEWDAFAHHCSMGGVPLRARGRLPETCKTDDDDAVRTSCSRHPR